MPENSNFKMNVTNCNRQINLKTLCLSLDKDMNVKYRTMKMNMSLK